jgi:hypothetical protein
MSLIILSARQQLAALFTRYRVRAANVLNCAAQRFSDGQRVTSTMNMHSKANCFQQNFHNHRQAAEQRTQLLGITVPARPHSQARENARCQTKNLYTILVLSASLTLLVSQQQRNVHGLAEYRESTNGAMMRVIR